MKFQNYNQNKQVILRKIWELQFTWVFFWLFFCIPSFAQSELKEAAIPIFKTTKGNLIENVKIRYRTVGKMNKDKTNVVLWTTWFTGTSEDVLKSGLQTMDTTGLYIVIVDALTNGISSSPSNSVSFPTITIRDIVNSQYILLTEHLDIQRTFAVMGISMGGMQALEWAVAYPNFSKKIVCISGTPKPSFYDMLVWQTMADLISNAGDSQREIREDMKRVYDIFWMNAATPAYLNMHPPDSLTSFRKAKYQDMINPQDYFAGLQAMMNHDIFEEKKSTPPSQQKKPKGEILIIVSPQDRLVNPQNSLFLIKKWKTDFLILEGDCGHGAAWCESPKVRTKVSNFLGVPQTVSNHTGY